MCESDQEIVFVSFVRACERSCAWPRDDVVSVAGSRKLEACSAVAWRVPLPSLRRMLNHVMLSRVRSY